MAGEWRNSSLADVCDRVSVGYVGPTSEYFCESSEGVRMLRSQNVRPGRMELNDVKYVRKEFHNKNKKSQLKGGDILFVRVGQNRGDCCIVPEGVGELNCANIVFARPRSALGAFLGFYFRSLIGQQQLRSISTGSAQGVLNTGAIASLKVPVPSDGEAQAIAGVLGALDDKIELNRRMNETLEALAQSLFKSWFIDTTQDGIPDKWNVSRLGGLSDRVLDRVSSPADWAERPLIDLSRMPQKSIALADWGLGAELTTSVTTFQSKDTLFGAIRPYFHKVGIAPINGVTNISVFVIRPKRENDWPFIAAICSLTETVEYANRVSKGTKMPVVSWPDFAGMEITVPPEIERDRYNRAVAPLYERIISNIHESRTLAALRDALLPKLLSGELRVKEANA
jgi:type I restriction enzyme S subunit